MRHFYLTLVAILLSISSFAVIGPITGPAGICVGHNVTLADTTTGGAWSSSNTAIATIGSSTGVVTGVSAGTVNITYTVGVGYVTCIMTVMALPTAFTVTGGGSYCAGGTGFHILFSGSDIGTNYQLRNGVVPVGAVVSGTGSPLDFGLFSSGTYTIIGSNPSGCTINMTGSSVIIVNPTPAVFNVIGGGSFCTGGAGVNIVLSGSTAGVNYQIFRGTTVVGAPIAGTGSPIDFGSFITPGTYTVVATNPALVTKKSNLSQKWQDIQRFAWQNQDDIQA